MKTFEEFREQTEQINELSTSLLKRYKKKADAQGDAYWQKKFDHQDGKGPAPTDAERQKARKRSYGSDRADMKIKNNKKGIKVAATGGPTAAQNKKVKGVAQSIAKAHPNLKVSSHGNEHFIHHKDDEDGHEHIHVTHAGNGKVHVTHSYGMTGGSKKTLSHADAVKHGHSIVKGN